MNAEYIRLCSIPFAPFGAHVWMSYHNYLGPTFYRSENAIKPIQVPSKKTWDAFGKWNRLRLGEGESK